MTEAAALLGCTEEGIRAAVRRGGLPAAHGEERRPHRTFIAREELERYRQERQGKPGRKPRAAQYGTPIAGSQGVSGTATGFVAINASVNGIVNQRWPTPVC